MEILSGINSLIVRQKKEWGEILTGFETKNRYAIYDQNGRELYYAAEVGGNMLARMFMQAWRPFEILIADPAGNTVLQIKRPFRWYFHEVDIIDSSGNVLGTVKRNFSWLRRKYSVFDNSGQEQFQLFGPFFRPWTFQILDEEGNKYGKITKKWSGLGKEMFTDADNFGVEFPVDWPDQIKAIFLGAVFLIDFVHFESKND